jgi:hypothetical protein
MAMQLLSLVNLSAAPFSEYVGHSIEEGLRPLFASGHLEIDSSGSRGRDAWYTLEFRASGYRWGTHNRSGHWHHPLATGVTGAVWLEPIRLRNYCSDVEERATCEPVFRATREELGKAVALTALHEIGHILGLLDRNAYAGADDAAHNGEPGNPMFVSPLHREFVPFPKDGRLTVPYRIRRGDTISRIARRVGFWEALGGWNALLDLKGPDGRTNRDRLQSGDPDRVTPGEEILIPDVARRAEYFRRIELASTGFTRAQLDTMRRWIAAGRRIDPLQVGE